MQWGTGNILRLMLIFSALTLEVVIQLPKCVNTQKFVSLGYTKKSDFYCMQIYLDIKANLKKFKKKSGLGQ